MIVTISGRAGAGKDEVANAIRQKVVATVNRFAEPLKSASTCIFGEENRATKERPNLIGWGELAEATAACFRTVGLRWTPESKEALRGVFAKYWDPALGCYALSRRVYEQLLGTELIRSRDPDAFVKHLVRKSRSGGVLLVPDCRFLNELVGSVALYVYRPGLAAVSAHSSEAMAEHIEKEIIRQHYPYSVKAFNTTFKVIYNTGSLEDLVERATEHFEDFHD